MAKIPVGILGATGMVGQNYINLLHNHPWFEVTYAAASPRSAGMTYAQAVSGRWIQSADIPSEVRDLVIEDANDPAKAVGKCAFVFSALELPEKSAVRGLESAYAAKEIPVISNASAHRWTENVPMLIPEINADHSAVIKEQQKQNGWKKGFIAVKPNCSIQSYMLPFYALIRAGYPIKRAVISTMQAVSGAGYPGVSSMDIIDNIVPFIGGEEEKSEKEPLKIFGSINGGKIQEAEFPKISAHCNRVPVLNGHVACVSMEFLGAKPEPALIKEIWRNFTSKPQELKLPSAPERPIVVRTEPNRPQPRHDRDIEGGMAVSVGRLRACPVFDARFVGLSHNTKRGAAGGGILNAELLKAQGFLDF